MSAPTHTPLDLRPAKAALRAPALERRASLSPDFVTQAGATVAGTVTGLPIFSVAGAICSYLAYGNEMPTRPILQRALDQRKRVALPRTLLQERRLVLHEVTDLDQLVPGPYGILEPPAGAPEVDPAEVAMFLVPGVVFDSTGNRIGHGAGLYDSLLVMSEGWRVALAYAFQVLPHIPAAEHDMPMDMIVTEQGLLDCSQGQLATDHLRLRNMIFYGHHGAFPQEREHGIRLSVDLDLRMDLQLPGITDDLETTVDYPRVYRLIDQMQSSRQFTLLEAFAEQVAAAILEEYREVVEVKIIVRKFNPPVGGLLDAFEVEVSRSRPAWLLPSGA